MGISQLRLSKIYYLFSGRLASDVKIGCAADVSILKKTKSTQHETKIIVIKTII
jgi:hypothetical protein